jgi:hypothetical protein
MTKFIPIDSAKAERELARLHSRATAYEIAFKAPDGTEYLVCHSERKTNRALHDMLIRYRERVSPLMDETEGDRQRRTQCQHIGRQLGGSVSAAEPIATCCTKVGCRASQ